MSMRNKMRYLWLSEEQARAIARHALDESPREACGIIGGKDGCASVVIPVANIAQAPLTGYRMDDATLIKTLLRLRGQGLELLGFYHSHPNSPPIPSRVDICQATYPDTAYVIVGLGSALPEFTAWILNYGDAEPLALHIGNAPPPEDVGALSSTQKAAIIVCALLAFIAMLAISLSLLPPAPEIFSAAP